MAVSTVSRFLNGHYVSATVRERLAAVIADLGYSRSWTARNLSLGLRGSVGVLVDSSDDPWFVQLLLGIEEELGTHDSSLMLSSLELLGRYDPARVLDWVRGHRVDGLIVAKSQRRDRPIALVEARTEVHVQEVDAADVDGDEHLPRRRRRHGHVFEAHLVGTARFGDENLLHVLSCAGTAPVG